jgi:hypothetical protein
VHRKAVYTFALLLPSILVTLAYIKASVNRVCNAVHDEGLELIPGHVVIAMNHPIFLRLIRQPGYCVEHPLLVRCEGAWVDLEDRR